LAFAVNFGNEKSPKSESDSLSLNAFLAAADGFEIGFAVADFLGTARLVELFELLELFFEETFFDLSVFRTFSASLSASEKSSPLEQLRSFVERPFFSFLKKKETVS